MPRTLKKSASVPLHIVWTKRLAKGCPAGLLSVADLLIAHPARALEILDVEIHKRHHALALMRQAHSFVVWRMWDAFQSFLIMSALIVSLLWTFRGVARVREWFHGLDPRLIPGGESFYKQLQSFFAASPLGEWPWEIPALIVASLVIGLFARHIAVMLFSWRELRPLRGALKATEGEMRRLETWKAFAREQIRDE